MTAKECYYMGRCLYDAKFNQEAIEWLLEARARIMNPNNVTLEGFLQIEDVAILEFLGPAFFNNGQ